MKNTAYFLITAIAIVVILSYGQNLIIPFIFALVLWFLVRKIRHSLDRIKFIKKHLPYWFKNLITSILIISILGLTSRLLLSNINSLADSYTKYEENVDVMVHKINVLLEINLVDYLKSHAGDFNFGTILKHIFQALTDLLSNAFIILIYALFIFLEETYFSKKLKAALNQKKQYDQFSSILEQIEQSITNYIGLKTLVSFITGFASYIALLIIGIDAPLFWAFLIFLLNYIPTIGSLIGTLFPALFCLLQFGEFTPCLIVLGIVGTIQILVGNLLEPKLMGNSLNISSFIAIFALSFWGAIWGVTGMILSIPITVILVIIFSHFDNTKPIAIMLSEKGELK